MRILIASVALLLSCSNSEAAGRLRRQRYEAAAPSACVDCSYSPVAAEAGDALEEVNAARAARGLRPFVRDESLTVAARLAASFRAAHRIAGHTDNDFRFLPSGASARAAGCGALEPSWGFRACCVYESWTYAGAATVRGSDGRLYHHLFVR